MRKSNMIAMSIIFLWISMFITSSGIVHQVDPDLDRYVVEYYADAYKYGLDTGYRDEIIGIYRGPLKSGTLGICHITSLYRWIEITDKKVDPEVLRALVYHELTHCIYNMDHTRKVGIMGEYMPSLDGSWWRDRWDSLRDNLFKWIRANYANADEGLEDTESKWISSRTPRTCPLRIIGPVSTAMIAAAQAGCKRIYGKRACLIEIEYRNENAYWALCRRVASDAPLQPRR